MNVKKNAVRSQDDIQSMLASALLQNFEMIASNKATMDYYNELLGDAPFLLAGLLGWLLKKEPNSWPSERWIDDSLITKISADHKKVSIRGCIIWGKINDGEQWVEPFYFHIDLQEQSDHFGSYTFLFSDLDKDALSYTYFRQNRSYWDEIYDNNNKWDPDTRSWRYIFGPKSNEVS